MSQSYNGKCDCGQVEWTADLEKDQQGHVICHCNTCKRLSGGAWTLNQIIPKKALKITKGADNIGTYTYYGDSGKPVNCYYCKNCTTHVYHHQTVMGDDTIVLRTVLLDKASELKPGAEIFGKDKFGWEPEIAKTFDVLPPELS